jgi:hypothetical protein
VSDNASIPSPSTSLSLSAWARDYRKNTAKRPDGVEIARAPDGEWHRSSGDRLSGMLGLTLDEAIELYDRRDPPAGWKLVSGRTWVAIGWVITKEEQGWQVKRASAAESDVRIATKTFFKTADRARRWCELRNDRAGARLRGPLPRTGQRANVNYPDVRCTPVERAAALDTASRLNLSFAELSRLSIDLTRSLTGSGDVVLGRSSGGQLVWARKEDGLPADARKLA